MIVYAQSYPPEQEPSVGRGGWLRQAAVWSYVALLAWAPFPLGGAVHWGSSLQSLVIAGCLSLWVLSQWGRSNELLSNTRVVIIPLVLVVLVLLWAFVQTLPIVPLSWVRSIWPTTAGILGRPVPGAVSLNPWRTEGALLTLSGYVAACWLAFSMGRKPEIASFLLNAAITIGALYVLYGFTLAVLGTAQVRIIYGVYLPGKMVSGPFMLHNSFATYAGLITIAAIAKLVSLGRPAIVTERGIRQFVLTALQFVFGRGAPIIVVTLLSFAGVVASASRAGFAATMCGILVLAAASLMEVRRDSTRLVSVAVVLLTLLPVLFLISANGALLGDQISQLLSSGSVDKVRAALWAATRHMIAASPWLGLGLGTFQDAYPLYATRVFPFVMDKAHCDYLEFAAGVGLPAAFAWWAAMVWAFFQCVNGVRVRRRHRTFSLVAVGATVLVAVHSSVDFSLQLPAVGLLYATILGLGLAQSVSSRSVTASNPQGKA